MILACGECSIRHDRRSLACSWRSRSLARHISTCAGRCRRSTATIAVAGHLGADRHRPRRRRHPAHLRRRPRPMRCSASATCTRRIACGRWSSSGASATAGCPRSSARRRFRRIASSARSASAARRGRRGIDLPDGARQQINAYVAGVNAFIATHHGSRAAAGIHAAALRAGTVDRAGRLVWVKMMAWDLSANYSFELLRHDIARTVGAERMARADAALSVNGLSIVGRCRQLRQVGAGRKSGTGERQCGPVRSAATNEPDPLRLPSLVRCARASVSAASRSSATSCSAATIEALGSNNWVVDGTLTAERQAAARQRSASRHARCRRLWYLAHMSAGDFDVIGATLPGAPAVALGRNRFIAWGATNVAADVEDSLSSSASTHPARPPSSAARRNRSRSFRKRSREGRRARSARRARHAPRSARVRRDQRQQRRRRRRRRSRRRSSRSRFAGRRSTTTIRRSSRSSS